MYIRCYDSWSGTATQEQLWNLIRQGRRGWMSSLTPGVVRWYIPEELVSFALLIDGNLVRKPKLDYLA
jgi:hypothetical protein